MKLLLDTHTFLWHADGNPQISASATALLNWYFFKGYAGEYPFHFDDPALVETFFRTLQSRFLEVFHPLLITTRAYRLMA